VSIGETLARARHDAGLSIADISEQTSIRLSVIDGIEHDDFSACGGDHRARDHIAAIARTLGVESGPLIEEYATARRPAGWIAAGSSEPTGAAQEPEAFTPRPEPEPTGAAQEPEAFTPWPEPEPATGAEDTQPIPIGQPSEPIASGEPVHPLPIGESPYPFTPAETAIPTRPTIPGETAIPAWASGLARFTVAGRRPNIWIALGGALLAFAVLGGILLVVGASGQPTRSAAIGGRHRVGGASHPARTPPGHPVRSPRPTRPASPAGSRHVRTLVPASITAFGPGGTGHGDSPQLASQALAGKSGAPWHSAWYTTSRFGDLQSGTGLLLNMGRPVTITSARIALGNRSGADLVLRIGNAPNLASLSTVARANGAAGVVRLKTPPTRGRYVLIWFTRLPPDQAGTFQVSVYDIKLRGYR
jgi:transcriptional regulator with XRE-family HTH domain